MGVAATLQELSEWTLQPLKGEVGYEYNPYQNCQTLTQAPLAISPWLIILVIAF